MITIALQRTSTGEEGTFGTFTIPGDGEPDLVLRSGELPWHDNRPMISCIPSGLYLVKRDYSPRLKRDVYEIQEVPARSDCQFHSGNFCGDEAFGWITHVKGCTLLGRAKGALRNNKGDEQQAVTGSVSAIEAFEEIMRDEPFMLDVRDIPGENWTA